MVENSDIVINLLQSLAKGEPLSYGEEKRLARHEDSRVRRQLAARTDGRPEILYYLAGDSDSKVRREIAINNNAPHHADILLAQDHDVDVRSDLALKIGRLAPNLAQSQSDHLAQLTVKALEILARDEIVKVRKILAETLKDIAQAPPHIVRCLAEDSELEVCGPILRYSPLLDENDLLEIVLGNPAQGALAEISKRTRLPEAICDAIVDAGQRDAITALLSNESAQIREKTLDHIINQAPSHQEWHEPLAKRPGLSAKAAKKISTFLADSLLEVMRSRTDFNPETLNAVENEFRRRLAGNTPASPDPIPETHAEDQLSWQDFLSKARQLDQSGALSEDVIQQSVDNGQSHFVLAALTVKTSLAPELIRRIFDSKNPQGIVAILRKAKMSARLTRLIQKKTARVPPKDIIDPETNPMKEEDIEWQIGLFKKMFSSRKSQKSSDKKKPKTDDIYDPQWSKKKTHPAVKELDWERQSQTPPFDDQKIKSRKATFQKSQFRETTSGKTENQKVLEPDWAQPQNTQNGGKKPSQTIEPDWATNE